MTETDKSDPSPESKFAWVQWVLFSCIAIAIVIAILMTPAVVKLATGMEPETAGEFGDMFGAANALFSGLALLGVVIAIILQSQELALQRQELRETREVLKEQRNEMKLQNAAFGKQQFESMFFQMVSLHNQIVNDLDTPKSTVKFAKAMTKVFQRNTGQNSGDTESNFTTEIVRGRDVFEVFYEQLRLQTRGLESETQTPDGRGHFDGEYDSFYQDHSSDLGHYFRNLYTIVKYADEHGGGTAQTYVNILRAQLSAYELALLFYNCTCGLGVICFAPLVEKYALLEHMEEDMFLDESHATWIGDDAFKERLPDG
ncbi:hypothetical protein Pla52o_32900 [Novipirellula galeiformis]|uniref:Phage abortive infection protein n=1 Tax=Novipirellula galeiformis TaxID=2528004 RepID=A0A5C6CFD5_9BACT|nr:putative phage abortive infection protein [Novipirellula galeiformis]TWU22234.1 hypothetical protein Pla52o_32900 [Novipirellula galeiformis]